MARFLYLSSLGNVIQCFLFCCYCVLWNIGYGSTVVAAFTNAPPSTLLLHLQQAKSGERPFAYAKDIHQRHSLLALQASTLPKSTQPQERTTEVSTVKTSNIQAVSSEIERFSSRKGNESTRLAKARLLLEQLQTSSDETEPLSLVLENGESRADSQFTAGTRSKTELTNITPGSRVKRPNSPVVVTPTNVVVPDTYWSNGHLDDTKSSKDSLIVTRWARGVKVAEPLVKYDPIATEKKLFRQPAKWFVRNIQIAFPLGFWAVSVVFDFMTGQQKNSESRRVRAQQLTKAISSLGPAIIKGGQALASRPDLLPSEYLQELQKLQDDVPRFENSVAFRTVEEELGIDNFYDVFELVETEPIAAASIGQVYKAILRENGATVALKIQRPDCESIIALDLYVLRWWSGIYNKIFTLLQRDIDLQSVIDDFGELIYREIDYVAEAANAQRFNELYAGVTDIFVPKVYSEYTTNKVLTMEWVDGVRLTDHESMKRFNLDESKLVDSLVQCSLRQILENGFFHADPHAGNLLACPDGRLCYLDFGMMSYANSKQRNGFLLAVVHIVNRDWNELVKLYVRLGFIPEGTDLQPIENALENALPDILNADVTELNFKNVINKLGDIMYTYPFSLPPFYIAIIRCLGVLEGLAIQVDPKARIISKAYPYIASRVLTDPQDDLQEALRRLALTSEGNVRWNRLSNLLDEAKGSSGYDVAAALDLLTDYLIAKDNDKLLTELSQQIVDAADNLGADSGRYLMDAIRALAINDEVAAVRAFRSLTETIQITSDTGDGVEGMRRRVSDNLRDVLPEPTPTMRRFLSILELLGAQNGKTDPAKFVPIVRKLSQDPRVQQASMEIVARLGERLLSRSLRAAFGLPPPRFGSASAMSTVTEDKK